MFDPSRIEIKYKVTKGKVIPAQEIALLKSIFQEVWQKLYEFEAEPEDQGQTILPKQG